MFFHFLPISYLNWYNVSMKEFISHFTAACHWNIPCIENIIDQKDINRIHNDHFDEITITNRNKLYRKEKQIKHVCELPLPRGAVVYDNGKYIASPELVFLELATSLDFHRLVLLGLQMCSHTPDNNSKSITTKRKISNLLAKTKGHNGHFNAEHALRYVENDSASIMESIAFMILSLPNNYGGFGLNGILLNYEIQLKEKERKYFRQKRCFVDFYYKNERIAVEYDSFTHHNTAHAQGKDHIRKSVLENQGIEVLTLSTIQLFDESACTEFAQNLAKALGKRIRIRAVKFYSANKKLRGLLPTK